MYLLRCFFIVFTLFSMGCGTAEKLPSVKATNRVALLKKDTLYQFYAEQPPAKKFKVRPDRFYHWYTQDTILSTQGSFSGRLLNRTFKAFYPNHNVYQEGLFQYGLKEGLWRVWYPAGGLKSEYSWKKGALHGDFIEYDEAGKKKVKGRYREGSLRRTASYHLSNGDIIETLYENGQPAQMDTVRSTPLHPIPSTQSDSTARAKGKQ